jgi:hypothetical protein
MVFTMWFTRVRLANDGKPQRSCDLFFNCLDFEILTAPVALWHRKCASMPSCSEMAAVHCVEVDSKRQLQPFLLGLVATRTGRISDLPKHPINGCNSRPRINDEEHEIGLEPPFRLALIRSSVSFGIIKPAASKTRKLRSPICAIPRGDLGNPARHRQGHLRQPGG